MNKRSREIFLRPFTYDTQGRVVKQSNGLEFFYDHTAVVAVSYNGNMYFYRKDVQGNIIAIVDSNRWLVVEYSCGKIRIGDQGIKMETMVVAFIACLLFLIFIESILIWDMKRRFEN